MRELYSKYYRKIPLIRSPIVRYARLFVFLARPEINPCSENLCDPLRREAVFWPRAEFTHDLGIVVSRALLVCFIMFLRPLQVEFNINEISAFML